MAGDDNDDEGDAVIRMETRGLMNACRMFATKLIRNYGDFTLADVGQNEEAAWTVYCVMCIRLKCVAAVEAAMARGSKV